MEECNSFWGLVEWNEEVTGGEGDWMGTGNCVEPRAIYKYRRASLYIRIIRYICKF
jgi:hypothetical protein